MGILDEAIRQHLDLKRQHGAADTELQQLEDEAFGPPARPGAEAIEAAVAEAPPMPDEVAEAPTTIAEPAEPPAESSEPLPEAAEPAPELEEAPEPVAEEAAAEHRPVPAGDAETVAAETEEHPPPEPPDEPEETVVADQPTELYDLGEAPVEEEPAGEEPTPEPAEEPAVEDEFFSEQSLSDELDQALDAPGAEPALEPEPAAEPEPLEPESDEHLADGEQPEEEEDVLEETPEFLQDQPEGDSLWFEQKPPKDFDFDD